jgi:hypothetical protein
MTKNTIIDTTALKEFHQYIKDKGEIFNRLISELSLERVKHVSEMKARIEKKETKEEKK